LRARLFVLWVLSLAASAAVGALLVQFYRQSTAAQVQRAEAVVARACDMIRDRYAVDVRNGTEAGSPETDARFRTNLATLVSAALLHQSGIEGGIWRTGVGSIAYTFPTYQGTGPKTDVPAAELDRIRALNLEADRTEQPVLSRSVARTQTSLVFACPLRGPVPGLTGWTMTRVEAAPGYDRLRLGLGVLLALMLGMTVWLTQLVIFWSRRVRQIETTLLQHAAETLPRIELTGERELDRIVDALNDAGNRLLEARRRSDELAARVAAAERLAALGQVSAGIAHEIRNPIAAIRLKVENALAGNDERRRTALPAILGQVARLDRLVSELLTMTQRREAKPGDVDVSAFLQSVADDHRDAAAARAITLAIETDVERARFDADLVRRAVGNLVQNAIQHTPEGGAVTLSVLRLEQALRFRVADTGPGIAPEVAEHLFEPFVTGRANGTGLGLAIVRELAEAHGGRAALLCAGGGGRGAIFALDLPWPRC
jgi:signal transduction histidine kinase